MQFPRAFSRLEAEAAKVQGRIKSIDGRLECLDSQKRILEDVKKAEVFFRDILKGLATSWQEPDPGKYKDVFFFLDKNMDRVLVREFIPGDTPVCNDRVEWEEYLRSRWWSTVLKYEKIPPHFRTISFEEIVTCECSGCQEQVPLVEQYGQTYDGPDGDLWTRKRLALCLTCVKAIELEIEGSESRMR